MDAAAFSQHCAADRGGDALFLPGWSAETWRALLQHTQAVALGSGEVLIKSGASDRSLYLVARGALELRAGAGRGDALGSLMRELPGAVSGEISFFDGWPRTATVWATRPSQLLRLDLEGLHAFSAAHPARGHELLFALARVLAFRFRSAEERRAAAEREARAG